MFPLPRILYAMARDGLLFTFLSKLSKRQSPAAATMAAGTVAAIMAFLFDLKALVDMMSIGTLLAYSLVAVCVLILRYQPDFLHEKPMINGEKEALPLAENESEATQPESRLGVPKAEGLTLRRVFHPALQPTEQTSAVVNAAVAVIVLVVCVVSSLTTYKGQAVLDLEAWILCLLSAAIVIFIACIFVVWKQPQTQKKVSFMVPLLPFLPILSIFVNVYLMVQLSGDTWIRFSVWMAVGFLIYFGYGMWHSVERQRLRQQHAPARAHDPAHAPTSEKDKEAELGSKESQRIIPPERTSEC